MPIQSLNWNDKIRNLAGGDNLSDLQKKSLLDQYNSNISGIKNQLGYLPTYGATTNPSRSDVSIVASAYDTSGNGGRKVVRLNNGTLFAVVKTSTPNVILYKSTDNGATWTPHYSSGTTTSLTDVSIATNGTYIYLIFAYNTNQVLAYVFSSSSGTALFTATLDTGQTATGNCSLTYSPTDSTLHAAWASKNATYPNSFNIRYAKGTINGDGSVTWGSAEQVSTLNTTGQDRKNPSIVMRNDGFAVIMHEYANGTTAYTIQAYHKGSGTWTNYTVYNGSTYTQSSPSATVDGNGHIHVVWHGMDSTDTTRNNIRYSKSTDGGVTWSVMLKLTTGNTNAQAFASITTNNINELFVYWHGAIDGTGNDQIRSIKYSSSTWGSIVNVTTNTTNLVVYPSLCDNYRDFTSPLVIWKDLVSPSVKFSGTWTDTPIINETISIDAVSNRVLIDAIVTANYIGTASNKKKFASGTYTITGSTMSFSTDTGGTSTNGFITVTGLSFTPKVVIVTLAGKTRASVNMYGAKDANGYYLTFDGSSGFRITGNANVVAGGFTLPLLAGSTVDWVAYE